MKQLKIITIGIFTILLIIGLSGCIDDIDATSKGIDDNYTDITSPTIISLSELKDHPNRYLDNITTIKAFFGNYGSFVIYTKKWNGAHSSSIDIVISDDVDKELLMVGEEYYFIGILRYNNDVYFEIKYINLVYQDNSNTVTLKKISEHPASYIKRNITVKGTISKDFSYITDDFDKWEDIRLDITTDNVNTSILIPGGEYYFSGILSLLYLHISSPASRYDLHKGNIIDGINFNVEKIIPV